MYAKCTAVKEYHLDDLGFILKCWLLNHFVRDWHPEPQSKADLCELIKEMLFEILDGRSR